MNVAVVPPLMSPVSKLVPLVALSVCVVPSWLDTVTCAPGATVNGDGLNEKFRIVTPFPVAPPTGCELDGLDDEKAKVPAAAMAAMIGITASMR